MEDLDEFGTGDFTGDRIGIGIVGDVGGTTDAAGTGGIGVLRLSFLGVNFRTWLMCVQSSLPSSSEYCTTIWFVLTTVYGPIQFCFEVCA